VATTPKRQPAGHPGATAPGASRYRKLSPGPGSPASQVALDQRTRIQSAMIELAGEGGYEAVALRRLTTLSGVSTRTFYEHFEGKEECFLRTYELVVQRIGARVASAQAGEPDWSRRVELALQGLAAELVNKPRAARLALLEIFAAGPAAHEAMARTESRFEEMLMEGFGSWPHQAVMSPLLAKAIVSGVTSVARTRMLGGGPTASATASELSQWVLSLRDMPASDRLPAPTRSHTNPPLPGAEPGEREALLAATAKLAAANGYWHLTLPRILAAAGLRKKSFTTHFTGVEDCFLASLKQRTAGLVGRAMADAAEELPWSSRVHRAIENLCAGIVADPVTAKLVFVEAHCAGRAAVALQDELLANLARELLGDATEDHDRPISPVYAEASLGAIWGIVGSYVGEGRESQMPKLAPGLAFLLLAPVIGAG
jgi:AcrR family transcriptional regulator